jgi:hypothetical protein
MVIWHRAAVSVMGVGLALGVSMIAGCGSGGSGSGSDTVGAANPGRLQILLADAPVDGLDAVNVTITKIEGLYDGETESRVRVDDDQTVVGAPDVEPDADDRWVTLSTQPRTVNLLDYANMPATSLFNLGNATVPSGHYKKFRFTVAAVSLVVNGTPVTVVLPDQTVEVACECFVSPSENETLVLDFDAGQSLEFDGSIYRFEPEVRLLQQDHSGMVVGTVLFQATTPSSEFGAEVELTDLAGQVVAHTSVEIEAGSPMTMGQATFVMHAVPPGSYSLRVVGDEAFQGIISDPVSVQVAAGHSAQTEAVTLSR